jgi:hypothetical protein
MIKFAWDVARREEANGSQPSPADVLYNGARYLRPDDNNNECSEHRDNQTSVSIYNLRGQEKTGRTTVKHGHMLGEGRVTQQDVMFIEY